MAISELWQRHEEEKRRKNPEWAALQRHFSEVREKAVIYINDELSSLDLLHSLRTGNIIVEQDTGKTVFNEEGDAVELRFYHKKRTSRNAQHICIDWGKDYQVNGPPGYSRQRNAEQTVDRLEHDLRRERAKNARRRARARTIVDGLMDTTHRSVQNLSEAVALIREIRTQLTVLKTLYAGWNTGDGAN